MPFYFVENVLPNSTKFQPIFHTFDEAYANIKEFIEEVYNSKRLHSSIGYVPPNEFEAAVLNRNVA